MVTRHLHLKNLKVYTRQRCFSVANFQFYRCAHYLFDQNPHRNGFSVKHSMLDCLRKKLPSQALDVFKNHVQLGLLTDIDEVTLSLALKACSRGSSKPGYQIHGFAITSGFISYLSVSNAVMSLHCNSGNFDKAMCLFEKLSDPDIVSWNTILSGFEKDEDALSFALRMNMSEVVFDAFTYTKALAFCLDPKGFIFGLQLQSLIMKSGLQGDIFVENALITMYSRWKRMDEASKVFDEMPSRDQVSWNAILSGYTQEGNYGFEAISVFVEMGREGIRFDHVSFTSAVSACGHEKSLNLGRQIHCLCIKYRYDTHLKVANVLISAYSKCGCPENAKLIFDRMNERNVVSWTTILSIDEQNAMSIFKEMRLNEVYPNDVTFVGLIHTITIRNLLEEGVQIHGFCIKTSFVSESNVSNSLITMYAMFKSMDASAKVFKELKYRQIVSWNALISGYAQNELCQAALLTFRSAVMETEPNEYTFGSILSAIGTAEDISLKHGQRCHSHILKLGLNTCPVVSSALLDMYAKRGSIHESKRVFTETPERSQFAWTALISAYARHGDYESVMKWFHLMEKELVQPDSITFLSILTACGRKGMVDTGRELFNSMVKKYKIEPSMQHYSCMVDMLGRAGRLDEAEKLMGTIPGKPGLSVLQTMLGSCRMHGNVEIGERVSDALMGMASTGSGSYVLMANIYAEKGEWEKVARVRRGMREKGVKKEVGLSWVDVGDLDGSLSLHRFSSGDTTHKKAKEICGMVDCLGLEMKLLREDVDVIFYSN